MKKILGLIALLVIMFGMSGCTGIGSNMSLAPKGKTIETPQSGKAQIIFMRPSMFAMIKRSSVFEIIDGKASVVAIFSIKNKFIYSLEPGKHTFMVNFTGSRSRLMEATVEANKTYYVIINTKGDFTEIYAKFIPIGKDVGFERITSYLNACDLVETNKETYKWALNNSRDIENNYKQAREIWKDENEKNRAILFAKDGR